jgi:hypothetical protein
MSPSSAQTDDGVAFIHRLFRRNKFRTNEGKNKMDAKIYDKIVRRAAVLASRLLDSPQALHYFHATYFGENIEVPGARYQRYGSDKKIDTLTSFDIKSTREELILLADKVEFEFFDTGDAFGQCCCHTPVPGVLSHKSVIRLSTKLYLAAQNKGSDDAYNAKVDFLTANTMIHEIAHAAFNDVAGDSLEDCFEESFVAEAGFELESRIFGLCWDSGKVLAWYDWQTSWLCEAGYNMSEICHEPSRLVERSFYWDSNNKFLLKLFDESFWEGEYARRGGVALLPPPVIDICQQRSSSKTKAYIALPTSVKQLWMASEGISYPGAELPELASTENEIRK